MINTERDRNHPCFFVLAGSLVKDPAFNVLTTNSSLETPCYLPIRSERFAKLYRKNINIERFLDLKLYNPNELLTNELEKLKN